MYVTAVTQSGGLFQMCLPPSFNILDHISILVNVYRKLSQNWVLIAFNKMASELSFILSRIRSTCPGR